MYYRPMQKLKIEGFAPRVLRPPQKLQNRRFCVVLKILVIIFNTPKSEVLPTIRTNSKIGDSA